MSKEYILVCQGVEMYRTESQEKAINDVKEMNDEYFDYCQKCYDDYERPADNYVELYIEDDYEKELKKRLDKAKENAKEIIEICDGSMFKVIMGDLTKVYRVKHLCNEILRGENDD